jgi:hypothetical protein
LTRQEQKQSERRNFYLYIDEFQNFITPSMVSILSGARKYALGLILAHQDLRQLSAEDNKVESSVISNPYTRVCFRLGDNDARKLAEGFSFFESKDLQNLGIGEAICRIERAEYDFNLKTLPLAHVDSPVSEETRERLVALSRERYGTPKGDVEDFLAKQWQGHNLQVEPEPSREEGYRANEALPDSNSVVKVEEPRRKRKPPDKPAPLGRGGSQHKYLQQMVKRMAEAKGFKTTIEKQVLGGSGSIDVALERDGRLTACEICVSTSSEWELGNIQKCLASGFETVLVISPEKKNLSRIRDAVDSNLEKTVSSRIHYLTLEELLGFLDEEEAKAATTEKIVRGYKVKTKFRSLEESEREAKRKAIAQTILQAIKRMRDN